MAYDVFISHSRHDKLTADAVCNRLEAAGIRCWIAPRDVSPGADWTESILKAIGSCQIMVLVFSDNTNSSRHVRIEVAHAFKHELTTIPFRIQDTVPQGSLEYYLDAVHWLDALTPPLEQHLEALIIRVKALLPSVEGDPLSGRSHVDEHVRPDAGGSLVVLETVRPEAEQLEAEQREKERLEAEQREKERLEAEHREREEKERLEAERPEKERLQAEQREKQRLEAEKREKERLESEQRLEAEQREKERLEAEVREKGRLQAEQRRKERLEAERCEKERL